MALAAAFVVALITTPLFAALARRINAIDSVTHRSLGGAVPRVGGIPILVGIVTALAFSGKTTREISVLLACALPLIAVAFIDDFRNVHRVFGVIEQHPSWSKVKLASQFAAAILAVTVGGLLRYVPFGPAGMVVLTGVAIVFIVGYTNAFNFMDGVNGIAGLHAVVAGLTFTAVLTYRWQWPDALLSGVLVAATAGFLPWNLGKARAYLGDLGSTTLGFLLAAFAIRVAIVMSPFAAILPLVPFITDSAATMLRRAYRGERIWSAHKQHYYQRLTEHAGGRHALTAWTWTALTAMYSAVVVLDASWWWSLVPAALHVMLFVYIDRKTDHS